MIDEFFERAVDRVAVKGAKWFAPWKIRLKNSFLGFRPSLIAGTLKRSFFGLFAHMTTEDQVEDLMQRTFEGRGKKQETQQDKEAAKEARKAAVRRRMTRLDGWMGEKRLSFLLLMTMLSACLVAAKGLRELAVLAAFYCLCFLSAAMEEDYEPVCAGVRQRYLAAKLLRAGAFLTLLLDYFAAYAHNGLPSNVALQGAMGLMLIVHGVFYLSLVAFHRQQPLFLRVLSGVLGFAPALASAAGVALAAASVAKALPIAIGGLLRAMGICLAFISEQLDMITQLGGIRLRYGRLWYGLMMTIGLFMMLAGAWVSAL